MITDDVKKLADEGLAFGKIAEQLGVDRNTVTKSWAYWHESRGLPVPDGRTRRKSLNRKPPRPADDLPTPEAEPPTTE